MFVDTMRLLWEQALVYGADIFTDVSCGTLFLMSLVAVVWCVILYWLFVALQGFIMDRHLRNVPEVPGKLPVLGHALLLLGGSPWMKMANWSLDPCSSRRDDNKKNDTPRPINRIARFNVVHQRVVYVNDPALLKRVLLTNQRNYAKDIVTSYKHFLCLLGSGLVTSEGEKWRRGRLLLSHALRIDILEEVPEMAMKAVGRITKKFPLLDAEAPFLDMNEEFRHMTLQVIGETALSLEPEETDRIFPTLYLPIVQECNRRVWEPWRAVIPFFKGCQKRRRCLKKLNEVLVDIIQKRWSNRHKAQKNDIMSLCMSRVDKMNKAMVLQLRDDVKTILLAGHETSAALLTWATYEVLCHPDVRDKIVEEAKLLFDPVNCEKKIVTPEGKTWGVPTVFQVKKILQWSPATLRETLRKYSIVPLVMRRAVKNDIWPAAETGLEKDVCIPAGCTVAVGIQGVHNRPDIWPDPHLFRPERFIGVELANDTNSLGNEKYEKSIDPYSFIPFINGPRNCLGQHFSIMETEVALAYLFLNWDLHFYKSGSKGSDDLLKPSDLEEIGRPHEFLVPIVPHDGLKVTGTPRV